MKKFWLLILALVVFSNGAALFADEDRPSLKDYENPVFEDDDKTDDLLDS